MKALARKSFAVLITGALVSGSTFEAQAVVIRVSGGVAGQSGSAAAGGVIRGAAGELSGPLRVSPMALDLNGSLPIVAVSPSVSHSPASPVSALPVSARVEVQSRTAAPTREKVGFIARVIAPEIKAAAGLARAGGESAHSVGSRIDEALTGRRGHRISDLDAVNAIGESQQSGGLLFTEDWLEPEEAFEAAQQGAREAMFKPEFSFAEFDIESTPGGLRVTDSRFAFFGLKHEQSVRIRVAPTPDGKSLEVLRDRFFYDYNFKSGGMMMERPLPGKLSLVKAIKKVSAVMPKFIPQRVLYLRPYHVMADSKGMVYRIIDREGTVVDVDAITGALNWSPVLSDSPAMAHFVRGTVPAPTSGENQVKVLERNPASKNGSGVLAQTIGAVLYAGILGAVALGAAALFHLSALGAFLPVLLVGSLAALLTYVSGLQHDYYSYETYVVNEKALSAGSMMMYGSLLFGAAVVAAVSWNVFPIALGAVGFVGVTGMLSHRQLLQSPALMYDRAYEEALRAVKKMGKVEENLYFGDSTAGIPVRDGAQWKFNFYVLDEPGQTKGVSILVELDNGLSLRGKYDTRVHVYQDVTLPVDQPVTRFVPTRFERGVRVGPEVAQDLARREHPGLGAGLSVSLQVQKEGEVGPRSLWYHFFDDHGSEVAVEARSGEVRVLRKPERPTREKRLEQWKLMKKLKDLDSWMGDHVPLYETAKWFALFGVGVWLLDMAVGVSSILP